MAQSQTLLTISDITREAMRILKNNLVFTRGVRRDLDTRFAKSGAKIGYTVNVRKPPRYVGRTGAALSVEAVTETYVPVTLTTQFGVDISLASADLTLSLNDYSEAYLKPAVATIANKIDFDGLQQYKKVNNLVGTPGQITGGGLTASQGASAIMAANIRLDQEAAPDEDRMMLWDPVSSGQIVPSFAGLYNPNASISEVFKKGALGDGIYRFDHGVSQNVPQHTTGSLVAAKVTVNGAHAGGAAQTDATTPYTVSIAGDASTAYTLKAGDVITFANVFAVNPQSRQTTGTLKNFVVQADVTLANGTNTNISVLPYPVFSGAFQNVYSSTNTIASGAAVTPVASTTGAQTYAQNLAWHRDAFVLATAELELPDGGVESYRVSDSGLSIRVCKGYLMGTDQNVARMDILYGWQTLYPELSVRVTG